MNKSRERMVMTAFDSIFRIAATRIACSADEDLSLEFVAKESMRIALETVDLACIDQAAQAIANTREIEMQARVIKVSKDLDAWKAWACNQLEGVSTKSSPEDDSEVLRCELNSMIRHLHTSRSAR